MWAAGAVGFVSRLVRTRIVAVMTILLVLLCAIFVGIMVGVHRQSQEEALRSLDNLSAALAFDVSRNVDLLDLSLQAVVAGWNNDEVRALKPSLRHQVLFDHSVSARHFGPIRVLDRYGSVMASSDSIMPTAGGFDARGDFKAHVGDSSLGLLVTGPFQDGPDGEWSLAFSRRLNDAEGLFDGVVTGTLRLSYFHDAYRRMSLGAGGLLALCKPDLSVIAMEPDLDHAAGRIVDSPSLLASTRSKAQGWFQHRSELDGVDRVYSYRRIGSLPLVQFVAMTTKEIFAAFWQRAFVIGSVLAVLSTGIGVLLVIAKREIDERHAAEAKLRHLAGTDHLTGLQNRRAFYAALQRRPAAAAGAPAAPLTCLLMVDVDHFKSYNDAYGHLAGDDALLAIATTMAAVAQRHGGTAFRYGGEEFAALLSARDAGAALEIADELRRAVSDDAHPHIGSPFGILTVSVGACCLDLADGASNRGVLAAADEQLYRAKAGGRNRAFFDGSPPIAA